MSEFMSRSWLFTCRDGLLYSNLGRHISSYGEVEHAQQHRTEHGVWLPAKEFLERHRGVIGRTRLYEMCASGELPHLRLGNKLVLPADALDRLATQKDEPVSTGR